MTNEDLVVLRINACCDAKAIVKRALKEIPSGGPKDGPFFQMRRVADYLQREITEAESELE